jgi:predicted nucleotidyltransferase
MANASASATERYAMRTLRDWLAGNADIELAVLVGSRATGASHEHSDWDIALRWRYGMQLFERLAKTEAARCAIAGLLQTDEDRIDLIDLRDAKLAMRAEVAEHGVVLKGEDDLVWNHFLLRVWRELEDFYWDKTHAA